MKIPDDIAVTKSGDLVYTDYSDRTVNIVNNEKIEVIRAGDLKVDYTKQAKVVRYHGAIKKETIQFSNKGKPLYSDSEEKYITENRNLDICISDSEAKAEVVFNRGGKLRFRYNGQTPAPENEPFSPQGITTDSQSHILTADYNNHCIHIIDQDGQFLRYIDYGLIYPWGLCTDTNDNLFVPEWQNNKVKKIKYLQTIDLL
ncbi:tripartite motif-containing protein 2-like [Saccostrea echinata]|uniref:tripartite motif-containing protein 2-like n=1 Tax=Saccostrea echinata TaxID=191078 RepID=UPI002A83DF4F|nr:tripartite motif-containing protein 2-like [Saccostrea echinata]